MTSNEQILDRYIRHQTYLLRYAGGLRNRVLPDLAATELSVHDALIKWLSRAEGNRTLTGKVGRKWQSDFEKTLAEIRRPAWDLMHSKIAGELKELAVSEAAVGATIIETSLPVVVGMSLPPASKLVGIVNSQPFQGRTLKQWMDSAQRADIGALVSRAKIGIVQGRTPTQIAREIIGTKSAKYADGAARKAFRDTESIILTVTNGVQSEAKQALYEANADVIKHELFVATLDARTTLICASNDGKKFLRGEGPIPPLHFRCRSLRVPYVDPNHLGARGFDRRTERELVGEYANASGLPRTTSRGSLPRGHKGKYDQFATKRGRELVGQVPGKSTYSEWLKTQTTEFQNQSLGPTRAKMFRSGEITLDKFVARDGDTLTLKQLQEKGFEIPD